MGSEVSKRDGSHLLTASLTGAAAALALVYFIAGGLIPLGLACILFFLAAWRWLT